MKFRTRFAPSPTGPLHLGHAYSAILAHGMARAEGGAFLLRIEDTDITRSRPEWETRIYDDLRWLGLTWDGPVLRQSERLSHYADVIDSLAARGLIFPCSCRRRDIRAALSAPQEGVVAPPVYPGTCRTRDMASRHPGDALRLNMAAALDTLNGPLQFIDTGPDYEGRHDIDLKALLTAAGDAVLGRKEIEAASYVLAAVVDDAEQDITHVVRGADLFDTTGVQVLLQHLLGLPTPVYHHHRLIRDVTGKRLAKRDDSRSLSLFREAGETPESIRQMVGLGP